ncbi:hypothetical protein LTR17_016147 [Elasticomyces elasticus]|nr:hypothetical protein LTR17_016147 [Elasticomyces elasticus]
MTGIQTIGITTIVRDGDVVLRIGTPPTMKLLVSSTTLIEASKVFAALLGPNFNEGQKPRTPEKPVEVALPEDDADSIADMCRLLHGKPAPKLERLVLAKRILQFAVAVDKYACVGPLRLSVQGLLLGYLESHAHPSFRDIGSIAASAYLLRHPRAFLITTKRLIMEGTAWFSLLAAEDYGHIIPMKALMQMEEKRTAARLRILRELPQMGMPDCDECDDEGEDCDNRDCLYNASLCKAFGVSSWPPDLQDEVSINEALGQIKSLGNLRRGGPTCEHTDAFEEVPRWQFRNFVTTIEGMCKGLCLGCVRDGAADLKKACNQKHGGY